MNISRLLEAEYKYKIGEIMMLDFHVLVYCATDVYLKCKNIEPMVMVRNMFMYDIKEFKYKLKII